MSKTNIRQHDTRFMTTEFLNDVRQVVESDDRTINDHLQSLFIVKSFQIASSTIGWENIPMSIVLDIADLCNLNFADYIDRTKANEFPF